MRVDEDALFGVSCPSTSFCAAVDYGGKVLTSTDPSGGVGAWSSADIDGQQPLTAISCPSSSLCVAVDEAGNVLSSTNPSGGATAWHSVAVASPGPSHVSCPSTNFCAVVESDSVETTSEPSGDATAWHSSFIGTLPNAISCASPLLCVLGTGFGDVQTSTDPSAGSSSWSAPVEIAAPDQLAGEAINALSCLSNNFCVAVDGPFYTEIGGSAGDVIVSSNPTGGAAAWGIPAHIAAGLFALTCPSSSFCATTDLTGSVYVSTSPGGGPSAWTSANVDGTAEFNGISCPAATFCAAVDSAGQVLTATPPDSEGGGVGGGGNSGGGSNNNGGPVVDCCDVPTPALTVGRRESVGVAGGSVRVRAKGTSGFVALTGATMLPNGSEVDASKGRVVITVATTTPGQTQTAEVYGGRFVIEQSRNGFTNFLLSLPLTECGRTPLPAGSSAAIARRPKHPSGPTSRKLWVSENGGKWGTTGRYVSTVVQGTHWLTQDECTRSEVRVVTGKVQVHNLVTHKTAELTTGKHYTANGRPG